MIATERPTSDTIGRITLAGLGLIADEGMARLTLDGVAARAGVSKGALLHHFRSKLDLAQHLLRHAMLEFEAVAAIYHDGDTRPGAWTRAYVQATLDVRYRGAGQRTALFLVHLDNAPALQDILRETNRVWAMRLGVDGIDPTIVTLVRMAADGCWWNELSNLDPFGSDRAREAFLQALLGMIG